MSSAKIFSSNIEETIEEKVANLERKILAYQERISANDKIFETFNSLKSRFDQLEGSVRTSNMSLETLGNSVSDLHNAQTVRINKLQSDHTNLSVAVESGNKANEVISQTLDQKLVSVKKDLVALREVVFKEIESKASISHLGDVKELIQKICSDFQSQINQQIESTSSKIEALKKIVSEVDANGVNNSSYVNDYSNIMEKIAALKTEANSHIDKLYSIASQLGTQVDTKISSLRTELYSKPSDISLVKNDLDKKMEMISLDGSSATIRSQNAEQKVMLLEKKIENLALLVKKFELSK